MAFLNKFSNYNELIASRKGSIQSLDLLSSLWTKAEKAGGSMSWNIKTSPWFIQRFISVRIKSWLIIYNRQKAYSKHGSQLGKEIAVVANLKKVAHSQRKIHPHKQAHRHCWQGHHLGREIGYLGTVLILAFCKVKWYQDPSGHRNDSSSLLTMAQKTTSF